MPLGGRERLFVSKPMVAKQMFEIPRIIRSMLLALGMKEQDDFLGANFILFNTCAVRENAENHLYGELG